MGLDAYLFVLPREVDSEVDFTLNKEERPELIGYWRKNHLLQGCMAALYLYKGGQDMSFNGNRVVLNNKDLDELESHLRQLDYTQYDVGWTEDGEVNHLESDLAIISIARTEIANGNTVYYDSWW